MPVAYRIWAAHYVKALLPWQERWVHRSQHGCRAHHSVSDAVLRTAMELEQAMLDGEDVAGAALDFSKAFDFVPIKIGLRLLRELGLPERVLGPMVFMYANLQRRFKIRGCVGEAFRATNGIMQGCPLSVLMLNAMVSILTRALELQVPGIVITSYVDDVTILVRENSWLQRAFEVIEPFLKLTDQVLNGKKTYLFGINKGRTVAIRHLGELLKHKGEIRILGVTFYFDAGKVSYGISKAEIDSAIATNHRIRALPLPWWGRSLLCGSIVVGGLSNGSEVRVLKPEAERSLRTSMTACMWAKSGRHRSPSVIFTLLVKGHVVDATQATLTTRILRWARAVRNDPGLADTAWHMATTMSSANRATGPVNALLVALRRLNLRWIRPTAFEYLGTSLEVNGTKKQLGEFAHYVREAGRQMVWDQARHDLTRRHQADDSEQVLGGIGLNGGVDRALTLSLYGNASLSEQRRGVLRLIFANGVYTQKLRAKLPENAGLSPKCTHCDQDEDESLEHIWWHCPCWQHQRQKWFPEWHGCLADRFGLSSLPPCTRNCLIFNRGYAGPREVKRLNEMCIDIFLERCSYQ